MPPALTTTIPGPDVSFPAALPAYDGPLRTTIDVERAARESGAYGMSL